MLVFALVLVFKGWVTEEYVWQVLICRGHPKTPNSVAWVSTLLGPPRPGATRTTTCWKTLHPWLLYLFPCLVFILFPYPSSTLWTNNPQFVHSICCTAKVTNHWRFKTPNPTSQKTLSLGQTRAVRHPNDWSYIQISSITFQRQLWYSLQSHSFRSRHKQTWTSHTNIRTHAHILPA